MDSIINDLEIVFVDETTLFKKTDEISWNLEPLQVLIIYPALFCWGRNNISPGIHVSIQVCV